MPSALSIVPALYHRMASDGVLRYGSSREEWARTWRDRSLLNPPALLAAIDFEWREMPSLEKHDYWKDEYTFISFAQNGAGDTYCWSPQWMHDSDAAIVFTPHDENCAEVVAPSFEALLFRMMLEACACTYNDNNEYTEAEVSQTLRANAHVLAPYLQREFLDILTEIVARPLQTRKPGELFVLPQTECDTIIARELAFSAIGTTFKHMKD